MGEEFDLGLSQLENRRVASTFEAPINFTCKGSTQERQQSPLLLLQCLCLSTPQLRRPHERESAYATRGRLEGRANPLRPIPERYSSLSPSLTFRKQGRLLLLLELSELLHTLFAMDSYTGIVLLPEHLLVLSSASSSSASTLA